MKIGLVGPTCQELSFPFNAEDCINFFAVLDKSGKEPGALYGTPGLVPFSDLGVASVRGEFFSAKSRAFAICGSQLFEIDAAGNKTLRGSLKTSSGTVYIEENTTQIGIVDGTYLYIMDYATNTFAQVIGGLEYCTNGDFTSGTGWTTGAGWSIGSGVATASTSSAALSRTSAYTLVTGRSYTLTYTIVRNSGSIQPSIGGTNGVSRSGSGTFTEKIIAGATQDLSFTGSSFDGTLDNISVNDDAFGLPASVGTLTFIDSFFIVNDNGTGRFFKSAPNDGKKWAALDFATAESSPDNLLRPIKAQGQLFLMGAFTGEIWTNTGASAFPFQKVSGGVMSMGIYAAATALEVDNTLFWVGRNKEGVGIVYRANGFTPKRISTTPIEVLIRQAPDGESIRAWSYQEDGHIFYVLTGGGLPCSLVYDVTTDMWHKRAYTNSQGQFEQHLGCCYMNAFGKHLVGDRRNGNIYVMDSGVYDDNGDPLVAERIYTHLSDEDKRIRYNRLVIGAESGVGLQNGDPGSDPHIELQLSVDGARTWSDWYSEPIGKAGEYLNKAEFRRLGVAAIMTFKMRISAPVKRHVTGSYLK